MNKVMKICLINYLLLLCCRFPAHIRCYRHQLEQIFPSRAARAHVFILLLSIKNSILFLFSVSVVFRQHAVYLYKKIKKTPTPFDPLLSSLQPLSVCSSLLSVLKGASHYKDSRRCFPSYLFNQCSDICRPKFWSDAPQTRETVWHQRLRRKRALIGSG